jgi:hypothetical protein
VENGKQTPRGTPFEWSLKGYIRNDPRISHFLRLKTLAVSGFYSDYMDAGVRSTFLAIKFNRI